MATETTNYGLTKPGYSDTADVADINENMDKIDGVLNYVSDAIGIVVDGDKTAYADGVEIGQFVILRNSTITGCDDGLYKAAKTIPYNTVIDSTYLTAEPSGAANALNASLTLNRNLGAITSSGTTIDCSSYLFIDILIFHPVNGLIIGSLIIPTEMFYEYGGIIVPSNDDARVIIAKDTNSYNNIRITENTENYTTGVVGIIKIR